MIRVAGVYAVVGRAQVQIATTLEAAMRLPAWFDGGTIVGGPPQCRPLGADDFECD